MVVVSKEFLLRYNQVVKKLGVRAMTDEQFFPTNISDIESIINPIYMEHMYSILGIVPKSQYGYGKDSCDTVYGVVLRILNTARTNKEYIEKDTVCLKSEFIEEWNKRIDNIKPLPREFDVSLMQYVESISLDLDMFQSMQSVIVEYEQQNS